MDRGRPLSASDPMRYLKAKAWGDPKPGDRELPDSRLPEASRRRLKNYAEHLASDLTPDELVFLAGALEAQANAKAGVEARR